MLRLSWGVLAKKSASRTVTPSASTAASAVAAGAAARKTAADAGTAAEPRRSQPGAGTGDAAGDADPFAPPAAGLASGFSVFVRHAKAHDIVARIADARERYTIVLHAWGRLTVAEKAHFSSVAQRENNESVATIVERIAATGPTETRREKQRRLAAQREGYVRPGRLQTLDEYVKEHLRSPRLARMSKHSRLMFLRRRFAFNEYRRRRHQKLLGDVAAKQSAAPQSPQPKRSQRTPSDAATRVALKSGPRPASQVAAPSLQPPAACAREAAAAPPTMTRKERRSHTLAVLADAGVTVAPPAAATTPAMPLAGGGAADGFGAASGIPADVLNDVLFDELVRTTEQEEAQPGAGARGDGDSSTGSSGGAPGGGASGAAGGSLGGPAAARAVTAGAAARAAPRGGGGGRRGHRGQDASVDPALALEAAILATNVLVASVQQEQEHALRSAVEAAAGASSGAAHALDPLELGVELPASMREHAARSAATESALRRFLPRAPVVSDASFAEGGAAVANDESAGSAAPGATKTTSTTTATVSSTPEELLDGLLRFTSPYTVPFFVRGGERLNVRLGRR
jgi:hypothetical protein